MTDKQENKMADELRQEANLAMAAKSVSVPAEGGQLSEVIRKIARGDADASLIVLGQGSQKCKELISEGLIKEGHIICTVRSFMHHLQNNPDSGSFARRLLMQATNLNIGSEIMKLLGRKELRERGQDDRSIAYMHMAIYVGQSKDGKYWVTENAGGGNANWGKIELKELDASFDDFANDDSAFFVIKPYNSRETTRQNALATVGMKYKYHVKWFNCEAYTSICAGFYSPEAKEAGINPEHMKRVLFRGTSVMDTETQDNERGFWLNPFKDEMLKIFSEKKTEIDGHKYRLDAVLEEHPPLAQQQN